MEKYIYNLKKNNVELIVSGTKLILNAHNKSYYSIYEYNIEYVPKTYYDLLVWILFYGLGENETDYNGNEIPECNEIITNNYKGVLCSYSGGADSTALLLMLNFLNITPVYLNRVYNKTYTQNQQKIVNYFGSMVIDTNFELIRTNYEKPHGFNIGIGYCCLLFPLIPLMKAKYIMFGGILEGIAYPKGLPFRYENKITPVMNHIFTFLKHYNIYLSIPLAGISEVNTTKIVNNSTCKELACSCHVEIENNKCYNCYKCFRKEGILGNKIAVSPNIFKKLQIKPLAAASSTIYGIQHANYTDAFFERYKQIPTEWLERYDPVLTDEYNPPEISKIIKLIFDNYSINQYTAEDLLLIKEFCNYINNDNLYKS